MKNCLLLATFAGFILAAWCCEPDQYINGCKIYGNSCICGYGCRSDYFYKTRRACNNALRVATTRPPMPERVSNICLSVPCSRGICIQTSNDLGFACKCEGTGFYGPRCEKACPTDGGRGMVFSHECIVI